MSTSPASFRSHVAAVTLSAEPTTVRNDTAFSRSIHATGSMPWMIESAQRPLRSRAPRQTDNLPPSWLDQFRSLPGREWMHDLSDADLPAQNQLRRIQKSTLPDAQKREIAAFAAHQNESVGNALFNYAIELSTARSDVEPRDWDGLKTLSHDARERLLGSMNLSKDKHGRTALRQLFAQIDEARDRQPHPIVPTSANPFDPQPPPVRMPVDVWDHVDLLSLFGPEVLRPLTR